MTGKLAGVILPGGILSKHNFPLNLVLLQDEFKTVKMYCTVHIYILYIYKVIISVFLFVWMSSHN